MDLRSSFLQQYVQFLQKLGLTPIETKVSSPRQTIKTVRLKDGGRSHSPVHRKSLGMSASQYLQVSVAGGIILIELSYQHAYFCVRIYAFESSRVPGVDINQQLAMLFTDNCDRHKDLIHIHSFAHDFHPRTIQSYFHRPEMGFKSHYHVTRFLADFVKFFTPRPKFCRNHIHQEHQGFLSHNTPAPLLYQYLMDHPPPSMKKLSMTNGSINPQDVSDNEDEEYAVVNLIPRSAVYKDNKGNWCHDELDRSVIICRSESQSQTRPNSPTPTTPEPSTTNVPPDQSLGVDTNPNLLNLCFYVIVTRRYCVILDSKPLCFLLKGADYKRLRGCHHCILLYLAQWEAIPSEPTFQPRFQPGANYRPLATAKVLQFMLNESLIISKESSKSHCFL